MKLFNLQNFKGGWFLGNFCPTLLPTKEFEISIKRYKAGDHEPKHLHKLAEEFTVIVQGIVSMNNIQYKQDDIILIKKEESTDFFAITDAITCVVKVPSAKNDKYTGEEWFT